MQRYRYEIDNVRNHLRSLWLIIGLLLLVIVGFWVAYMRLPSTLFGIGQLLLGTAPMALALFAAAALFFALVARNLRRDESFRASAVDSIPVSS